MPPAPMNEPIMESRPWQIRHSAHGRSNIIRISNRSAKAQWRSIFRSAWVVASRGPQPRVLGVNRTRLACACYGENLQQLRTIPTGGCKCPSGTEASEACRSTHMPIAVRIISPCRRLRCTYSAVFCAHFHCQSQPQDNQHQAVTKCRPHSRIFGYIWALLGVGLDEHRLLLGI